MKIVNKSFFFIKTKFVLQLHLWWSQVVICTNAHYGHKINLLKALKLMHLWTLPLRHKLLFLIFIVTLMIRHAKGDYIQASWSFPLTKYDGTFCSPKFAIATNLIKQFYIANQYIMFNRQKECLVSPNIRLVSNNVHSAVCTEDGCKAR